MSPAKSICVLPLRNLDAMLKCRIAMSMAGAEAEAFLHGEWHDDEGGDSDMLDIQKCVEMASGPLELDRLHEASEGSCASIDTRSKR
jgi:hypothetical protein